jgi:hypothetical protein
MCLLMVDFESLVIDILAVCAYPDRVDAANNNNRYFFIEY